MKFINEMDNLYIVSVGNFYWQSLTSKAFQVFNVDYVTFLKTFIAKNNT